MFPPGTPSTSLRQAEQGLVVAAEQVVEEHGADKLSRGIYTLIDDNSVQCRVYLTDPKLRPISTAEFVKSWRSLLGAMPAAESLSFMSNRGGPGSGATLTVELSHRDITKLELASIELGAILAEFPNTNDIDDGAAQGKRQFDFKINAVGNALGLSAADVALQTRAAFQGLQVLKQQRGRNEVTVRLRLPESERTSQYDFENLILRMSNGGEVLLRDVVDMQEGRSYTTINRRDGRRILHVTANVEPPDQANQIVSALVKNTLPELQQRYPGLGYSFEGASG